MNRIGGMAAAVLFTAVALVSTAHGETGRVTGGEKYEIPGWFKSSFLDLGEDAAEAFEADRHAMLFIHSPE